MTRDDIIRMAREAGLEIVHFTSTPEAIERFAALVAAEKEEQMTRDGYRKCAEGQRTTQFCGLLDAAVKAEREACAKVCYEAAPSLDGQLCAEAIRARGEQEQPR